MKLQERFRELIQPVKNPNLIRILSDVEVYDITDSGYGIINPRQTIFIGTDTSVYDVLNLFSRLRVNNFVHTGRTDVLRNLIAGSAILRVPGFFLKHPLYYLLPDIRAEGVNRSMAIRAVAIPFQTSQDRESLLARAEEFLSGDPLVAGMIERALRLIDEMVVNALRSPIDANGRRLYPAENLDSMELSMGPDHHGRLFLAFDKEQLVIGCEDPFGSLDSNQFMDLLLAIYDPVLQNEGLVDTKELGIKLMIDNCSDFIMVSRRNIRTTVCCVLRFSSHQRGRLGTNFHFHFF
jgi:hypothetical protein